MLQLERILPRDASCADNFSGRAGRIQTHGYHAIEGKTEGLASAVRRPRKNVDLFLSKSLC